jgi:hypothetical protein
VALTTAVSDTETAYTSAAATGLNTEIAANAAGVTTTAPRKENIFWQVSGTVVVKANAHMEGILLTKTALTQTRCDLNQATITA